jgi:membrane protein involved in colicin uptake
LKAGFSLQAVKLQQFFGQSTKCTETERELGGSRAEEEAEKSRAEEEAEAEAEEEEEEAEADAKAEAEEAEEEEAEKKMKNKSQKSIPAGICNPAPKYFSLKRFPTS